MTTREQVIHELVEALPLPLASGMVADRLEMWSASFVASWAARQPAALLGRGYVERGG
jgi:hypothetical protein